MGKKGLSEEERLAKSKQDAELARQMEEVNRLRFIARTKLYPVLQDKFTPEEASKNCEWFNMLVQQALIKQAHGLTLKDIDLVKDVPDGEEKDKLVAIIDSIRDETVGGALKITGAFVEGIKTEKENKTKDWTWEQVGLDLSDAELPPK